MPASANHRQREKLSVIGHMVSSIAHDLSNPLATIAASAETILAVWPGGEGSNGHAPFHALGTARQLQEDLELILTEARRASDIISGLLAFAREDSPQWETIRLEEVVTRVAKIAKHHLDQFSIRIEATAEPDVDDSEPIWVRGDANKLSQVLMNLVINAQQAITSERGRGTIWLGVEPDGNGQVRLTVEDDGPGVPSNLHRAVLAPYYTTKPEGTGLGLAISANIVAEHGGELTITDRSYGGARLVVTLPVTHEPPVRTERATTFTPPVEAPVVPERRMLLVDDEPGIRRSITRCLARVGWRVRAVASGSEALDILQTESFDAILSDLRMPGLSGEEFYDALCAQHPELAGHVAFISGDTMRAESQAFLDRCGCPSLNKPYEMRDLVRLVESCGRQKPVSTCPAA